MKLSLALLAIVLVSTAAIAAEKPAKPKACPKGLVATTSRITGEQHCFAPTAFMVPPAQPGKGSKVTPPVLLKTN